MKRFRVAGLMGIFVLIGAQLLQAQPASTIEPFEIAVSYHQTTNLIFPYAIKSVDRGSGAVIVQKAKGVENILQAKATSKDFEPTNLSVVTADGRFYSFVLSYAEHPQHLNISFSDVQMVQVNGEVVNARQLEKESWQVLSMPPMLRVQRMEQEMQLQLTGIWLAEQTIWYKLRLSNRSQIDFTRDYLRFFLRDRKRSKRTAIQETEIFPVHQSLTERVDGLSQAYWIIGFSPFTVPPDKKLIIQVGEKAGGRTLVLPLKGRTVLRARKLPAS